MRVLLLGGRVLDPSCGRDETADVVIENGRITRVGPGAAGNDRHDERDTRCFDCRGRWILPGLIDLHTHLREPGYEYKEDIQSGTRAAAAGGFTTVCAMPNTRPVNDTRAVTEMILARARSHGAVRVHPIGAITHNLEGKHITEMGDLREAGCVAVSDDGRCVTDAAVMRRAMEYARTFDLPVIQHAEDHTLTQGALMHEGPLATRMGLKGWPRVAEDSIVARDVMLAELTGARYHVAHVSSRGSVALIREAKSRGLRVTAEVTPHHLLLTDEAVIGYRTVCKVNPPLREPEDRDALIAALADGTIDCVATDHAPHTMAEKECEFAAAPFGMIGLETCVPLLLELVRAGKLPLKRMVEALTIAPARVLDIPGGTLSEGAVADVTVIDPERVWTIQSFVSKSSNSPFVGREVRGAVTLTLVGGKVAFQAET